MIACKDCRYSVNAGTSPGPGKQTETLHCHRRAPSGSEVLQWPEVDADGVHSGCGDGEPSYTAAVPLIRCPPASPPTERPSEIIELVHRRAIEFLYGSELPDSTVVSTIRSRLVREFGEAAVKAHHRWLLYGGNS